MISIFEQDATDFTGNGLGVLTPIQCDVNETLNGEWELILVHPLDEYGKWKRLVDGRIIRAPVPSARTPQINATSTQHPGQSTDVYRVQTSGQRLQLRADASFSGKVIGYYSSGTKVIFFGNSGVWREVATPDGKHGYMHSDNCVFDHTEGSMQEAAGEVIESRALRDQPFRIYRVVPELTKVTVYARHIFYDLLDNIVHKFQYKVASYTAASVFQWIFRVDQDSGNGYGCVMPHPFKAHCDMTSTCDEWDLLDINPVEAILGSDGFVEKYGAEIARDWYDVYAVSRVGNDTDIVIREGKNLKAVQWDEDSTKIITRLIPVGETASGNPLYLPWSVTSPRVYPWVDSDLIDRYHQPRVYLWKVTGAKESNEKSIAQCQQEMMAAAQEYLDGGCDLPTVTVTVDFVNLSQTEEYKNYAPLQDLYMGDQAYVISRTLGIKTPIRMVQYTFDCLLKRYKKVVLGSPNEAIGGMSISMGQVGVGSISGSRLAVGTIGALNISDQAVTARIIAADAVTADAIQANAVGAEQIAAGAVTASKIAAGAITADSAIIAAGAIGTAQIQDAAITDAKIGNITANKITSGTLDASLITVRDLSAESITTGLLNGQVVPALGTSHILDGAITNAKITDVSASKINTGTLDALKVTVSNLSADSITSGTLDADKVTVSNLSADSITSGTLDASGITVTNLSATSINTGVLNGNVIPALGGDHIQNGAITDAKVASLSASKLTTGTLDASKVTVTNLSASSITSGTLDASTITVNNLAASSITTGVLNGQVVPVLDGDHIQNGAITDSKVSSLSASKLTTGILDATKVTVANLSADSITSGTLDASDVTITNLSADSITSGTLDASDITVTNLSATSINTGVLNGNVIPALGTGHIQDGAITDAKVASLSASKLTTGTLDASKVTVTNLSADSITSGTLDASTITVTNLAADSITTGVLNGQVVPVLGTNKIADSAITIVKLDSSVGTDLDISGNDAILLSADNFNNIAAQMLLMSESISSLVTDTSEQGKTFTTSVMQTANELRAVVTSVAELQALSEQTADSIAQLREFNQTYFSLKDSGLEIGKPGNPFSFRVDNDDLGFYYNGTLLSYMRGDVMYIEKANIGKSLQIGTYYSVEETGSLASNKRLGFYYLG